MVTKVSPLSLTTEMDIFYTCNREREDGFTDWDFIWSGRSNEMKLEKAVPGKQKRECWWSWIRIADHAKKKSRKPLNLRRKPAAEVLVEGISSLNDNSGMISSYWKNWRIDERAEKKENAEVFFMFLKLNQNRLNIRKDEPFGNSWMSCDMFKVWKVSPAESMRK